MMVVIPDAVNSVTCTKMNSRISSAGSERDSHEILVGKIRSGLYKISNKRKGRSEVWNIFGEIEKEDGTFVPHVVFCRNCHGILSFNGKQTSNLNRHKCYVARKEIVPLETQTMKSEAVESTDEDNHDDEIETEPEIKIVKPADMHLSKPFTILPKNSSSMTIQQQPSMETNKTARLDDPRVNAAYDILKATVAKNDDCAIFGDHVANKIRQYSSRTRSIVQHHINNVLFEADIGKYDTEKDPLNSNGTDDHRTGTDNNTNFYYSNHGKFSTKTNKSKNKK